MKHAQYIIAEKNGSRLHTFTCNLVAFMDKNMIYMYNEQILNIQLLNHISPYHTLAWYILKYNCIIVKEYLKSSVYNCSDS